MAENAAVGSLGDLLVNSGLISTVQLAVAQERSQKEDKSVSRVLVEMGALDERKKLALLKERFDYEVVSLEDFQIDAAVLAILPRAFCQRHAVAPILREKNTLHLAMEDPSAVPVIDEARTLCGLDINPVIATCQDIEHALKQHPGDEATALVGKRARAFSHLDKALHFSILTVIFLLPIPIFFVLLLEWDWLKEIYREMDSFSIRLFSFLIFALWIAVIYEINGLFFEKKTTEET